MRRTNFIDANFSEIENLEKIEETDIFRDLLIISYYMKENGWKVARKYTYNQILYFAGALAPIFLESNWEYSFTSIENSPYNALVDNAVDDLMRKGLFERVDIYLSNDEIMEEYMISNEGKAVCENIFFKLDVIKLRVNWLNTISKALSFYGMEFLNYIVKSDPNIVNVNTTKERREIRFDAHSVNLTEDMFLLIKEYNAKIDSCQMNSDSDLLLVFFDILYKKYMEGGSNGQ